MFPEKIRVLGDRILVVECESGTSTLHLPEDINIFEIDGKRLELQKGMVLGEVIAVGPEVSDVEIGDKIIFEKYQALEAGVEGFWWLAEEIAECKI